MSEEREDKPAVKQYEMPEDQKYYNNCWMIPGEMSQDDRDELQALFKTKHFMLFVKSLQVYQANVCAMPRIEGLGVEAIALKVAELNGQAEAVRQVIQNICNIAAGEVIQ